MHVHPYKRRVKIGQRLSTFGITFTLSPHWSIGLHVAAMQRLFVHKNVKSMFTLADRTPDWSVDRRLYKPTKAAQVLSH